VSDREIGLRAWRGAHSAPTAIVRCDRCILRPRVWRKSMGAAAAMAQHGFTPPVGNLLCVRREQGAVVGSRRGTEFCVHGSVVLRSRARTPARLLSWRGATILWRKTTRLSVELAYRSFPGFRRACLQVRLRRHRIEALRAPVSVGTKQGLAQDQESVCAWRDAV
jgi:hypothetical protein